MWAWRRRGYVIRNIFRESYPVLFSVSLTVLILGLDRGWKKEKRSAPPYPLNFQKRGGAKGLWIFLKCIPPFDRGGKNRKGCKEGRECVNVSKQNKPLQLHAKQCQKHPILYAPRPVVERKWFRYILSSPSAVFLHFIRSRLTNWPSTFQRCIRPAPTTVRM